MTLKGKVIVIVGGTSGIGLSAARAFRQAGARVVVIGRDAKTAAAAGKSLGRSARVVLGDAIREDTVMKGIHAALRAFGNFTGLYHVAGGSGRKMGDGLLHEIPEEGWESTLQWNLTSVFYSNRAAIGQFLKQKTPGTILNMSSVLASSPAPKYFSTHAYAAAKAGIIGLSRSAAGSYAPRDIRINVIAPSLIATPMSRRAQKNAQLLKFVTHRQPLKGGGIGKPEDLDAAAVYFMSDASRFVTGQVLSVDGGWSVTGGGLQ